MGLGFIFSVLLAHSTVLLHQLYRHKLYTLFDRRVLNKYIFFVNNDERTMMMPKAAATAA